MQHLGRLSNLPLAMAALMLSACHQDQKVVPEVVPNTTTNIETKLGLEVQVKAPDGTLVEKHFPLSDGRGHNFYHAEVGSLAKSYDEYDSTQSKRERCYAEWTGDGKSVLSGRISKPGGELVVQSTLLDSGVRQTIYSINPNLYAECHLHPSGMAHWTWWQGGPGKRMKWFEEVILGAGAQATRQSLEFFRPAEDPSAQPVRLSDVGPYGTTSDKSQAATVTFFHEDGVTPEFRQHWSRSWREVYGEEAYMNGNNGSGGGYGEWSLMTTEELDKPVNSRRNLDASHYERFRGDVRDSAVDQLREALVGTTTKDDVPELKWHVLNLPVF